MGAGSSKAKAGELTKHYGELLDSMTRNQIVFDASARNVARTEQEWFRRFEQQLLSPPATEDALHSSIAEFVQKSQSNTDEILQSISDPVVRRSAKEVLLRTKTSVVMQKYYEYKYLHLSAVFIHFTDFVQQLLGLMSQAVSEATTAESTATIGDIQGLLDAINELNLTPRDAEILKKSVRNVQNASIQRLEDLSRKLNDMAALSSQHIDAFPADQLREQRALETVDPQEPPTPTPLPTPPPPMQPRPSQPIQPRPSQPMQPRPPQGGVDRKPSGYDRNFMNPSGYNRTFFGGEPSGVVNRYISSLSKMFRG